MIRTLGAVALAAVLLSACGASASANPSRPHSGKLASADATTATPASPPTTTTLPPPPAGWAIVSAGPLGITVLTRAFRAPSGATMTVAEFPAATTAFHLHVGSTDPPGSASLAPADAGTAVSPYELSLLVAAFNGGFKQYDAAGGVEVDGTVVSPLTPGKASAVIDADGSLHVGVWGQSVPAPGERYTAVRQNLQLLVAGGIVTPAAANWGVWGATVGGVASVARSALGVDHAGNVFFVGSMAALPSDLAWTLVQVGVENGMQLDINPMWITLGVAPGPGAGLIGMVPGQSHGPGIFLNGWERDFFAVLARPEKSCRLVFPAPAQVAAPNPPTVVCGSPGIRPRSLS